MNVLEGTRDYEGGKNSQFYLKMKKK